MSVWVITSSFIAHQLQAKKLGKMKNLYVAFEDLEKSFDRVPRVVVRWPMRQLNVNKWLTETIVALFEFSKSAVRANNTVVNKFTFKVGVHQESELSPLLIIMTLEVLPRECRSGLPWKYFTQMTLQ